MTDSPAFELLPARQLRPHERVDPGLVEFLERAIGAEGVVWDPIWVARTTGAHVILNGHHRYRALVRLGAKRIPAWVFDYGDPIVQLGRWGEGPPLKKSEVLRRARTHQPFPPKTTRHSILIDLPERPTPLSDLIEVGAARQASAPRPLSVARASPEAGA